MSAPSRRPEIRRRRIRNHAQRNGDHLMTGNKHNRHPEELGAQRRASRRMEARSVLVAILRDGRASHGLLRMTAEFVSRFSRYAEFIP